MLVASHAATICGQIQSADDVSIAYSMPSHVSLGEPIIVAFVITNKSHEPIECDLGFRGINSFRLAIVDEIGGRTELAPLREEGPSPVGNIKIASGGRYTSALVLDEWHEIEKPGGYHLEIFLKTPIKNGYGETVKARTEGALDIQVREADKNEMVRKCQALLQSFDPQSSDADSAMIALSHVRDPVCVATIKRAIEIFPMFNLNLVWGLSRIGTDDAVEVILSTASSKDASLSRYAKRLLTQMRPGIRNTKLRDEIDMIIRK